MKIDVPCKLKAFRKFLILNACQSFIPKEWRSNEDIFPERVGNEGAIIIEAKYKELLKVIKGVKFVKAKEVLKIIYNSKSGRTKLIWIRIKNNDGKLTGEASINSVINLVLAGVIEPIKV